MKKIIPYFIVFTILYSCKTEQKPITPEVITDEGYKTENIFIVVMDGPRYSETWGDNTHSNISFMSDSLANIGIINTNFYNDGPTYTLAGHTSITTGFSQEINNGGQELPRYPSIFQAWLKEYPNDSLKAWIITSKDKLEVLANCQDSIWADKFNPSTNCGNGGNGVGSGYRHDTLTQIAIKEIINQHKPKFVLINYREPDYSGHSGNWTSYIKGIKSSDSLIYDLWKYIQTDDNYKNKTTLFVTNDHGRHLDGISSGFKSHGDNCEGCKHIFLYATGPDFKENVITNQRRNQTDITQTVAELLGIEVPFGNGELMTELFK